MRHRQKTPKLSRTPSHRDAMLRSMVTDFLRHEKIRTTTAKAKALRPLAERMITLGKRETLHARRHAARVIRDGEVIRKLFEDLAPRYSERPGGYTRITKLGARPGDDADMAIIELVEAELKARPKRKKRPGGPVTAAQETAAAAAAAAAADSEAEESDQAEEAAAAAAGSSEEADEVDQAEAAGAETAEAEAEEAEEKGD